MRVLANSAMMFLVVDKVFSMDETQQKLVKSESSIQGGLLRGAERHLQATSCTQKKVKIYKFCINGDDDSGPSSEHQLRLDGNKYFPNAGHDCAQDPSGFCSFREGQCHNLGNAPWRELESFKSMSVGTEEHDTWSENDSVSAFLTANDWYNPTCSPYEVIISRDFESAKQKSLCWNVDASGSRGGASINAGIESCTSWTEPAQSYLWFMKVEPVESSGGYFTLRSKLNTGYCLDIPASNTDNGVNLSLWECHGGANQQWKIDNNGYIRSKLNFNKCIDPEGPSVANGAPLQIWDCVDDYVPQKWIKDASGTIRSQWSPQQCIDLKASQVINGDAVEMNACHGGSNQQWI